MKLCRTCSIAKHETDFYAGKNSCKECVKQSVKARYYADPETHIKRVTEYSKKHAEEKRAYLAKYRKADKEQQSIRHRLWCEKNREHKAAFDKQYTQRWMQENRGLYNAKAAGYRARKLKATPKWADAFAIECVYTLAAAYRKCGLDVHVDHIIPLQGTQVCGLHVEHNLTILHSVENIRKSNKLLSEYL